MGHHSVWVTGVGGQPVLSELFAAPEQFKHPELQLGWVVVDAGSNPNPQQGEGSEQGGLHAERGSSARAHGQVQAGSVAQRSSRTHQATELLVGWVLWHMSCSSYFPGLQSFIIGSGI